MSILIKNTSILAEAGKGITKGDILVDGQTIAAIGEVPAGAYARIIDGSHFLAMPGLVNTHGHSAMCLMRGYADDLELMEWLNDKVFPVEARLTPDDIAKGANLAILEMLKSGTTAFADMYFAMDEVGAAVEKSGIRSNLCIGITDFEDGEAKLAASLDFARNWQGQAKGRIRVTLGPHAPYTCSPGFIAKIGDLARQHSLGIQIHLAETRDEERQIKEGYDCRPFEYLKRTGMFQDNRVLLAHGVWINPEEIAQMAKHDISVAHNPCSNMKLASGIAPVEEYLKAGVNLALGTDSACSNNKLDLFQEMRAAAYLAKVQALDPTVLPASQALKLGTVNGSKALGFDDCGTLEVGKKADLILINLDAPHLNPLHDLESHLVYAASGTDVDTVIINGELVMYKREILTLDEEKVIAEANKTKQRLFA